MAVRIRLSRIGRLNRPFYRVGVYDARTRRDGKILEHLGHYDPLGTLGKDQPTWKIDMARLREWMAKGAKVSGVIESHLRTTTAEDGSRLVGGEMKKKSAAHKARRTKRVTMRRKTGRTVEKSAKANGKKKA
ncbi:MAG TPA: 30S ribosomal protein S16 [Planctomycetota bacterium]|nr:30S ribosomal protein S16 [Planctomycetota bacterium]